MHTPREKLGLDDAASLLKALADGNRLRIVSLLTGGELCVCHVASALDLTQPNVSQHLSVLRNASLVERERRGGWIYYRLSSNLSPARAQILSAVLEGLGAPGELDRHRLEQVKVAVCCP